MPKTALPPHLREVDRAWQRFRRDTAGLRRPAWGRYTPGFAHQDFFSDPDPFRVNLQVDGRAGDSFLAAAEGALTNRCYQPETVRKYMSCLRRFVEWLTVPPAQVHGRHIACYLVTLKKRGASRAVLSQGRAVLRTVFQNVCGLTLDFVFYAPPTACHEMAQWTAGEVARLFGAAVSARDRLLVACLTDLKLTVTEALGIRACDIDFERNTVRVWPGLGRSERDVEVPGYVLSMLGTAVGRGGRDHVFAGSGDAERALSPRSCCSILKRAARRCGIPKPMNCRVLRRSDASGLAAFAGRDTVPKAGPASRPAVSSESPTHTSTGEHSGPGPGTAVYASASLDDMPLFSGGADDPGTAAASAPSLFPVPSEQAVANLRLAIDSTRARRHASTARVRVCIVPPDSRWVVLPGVRVAEHHTGRIQVLLPPTAVWEQVLMWLPRVVRERVLSEQWRQMLIENVTRVYERTRIARERWSTPRRQRRRDRHRFRAGC